MTFAHGALVGKQICEALGIETDTVSRIRVMVDISAKDVVTVHVHRYVRQDEFGKLTKVFERYRLVDKKASDQAV